MEESSKRDSLHLATIARYRPDMQQGLIAFREAQGVTSHERFLANLADPELGLQAWIARGKDGSITGYATGLPWQRRPGVFGVNLNIPKAMDPAEQEELALALAEDVRREVQEEARKQIREDGGAATEPSRSVPIRTLMAFPISALWLPAFTRTGRWSPFQELVHYRKDTRTIPPAPPVPPGSNLEVRPFVAATDLPAVLDVEHAAFPEFWWQSAGEFVSYGGRAAGGGGGGGVSGGGSSTTGRSAPAPGPTFDVMLLNGQIIGYNMNSATPPRGYVGRLGVHPAHQGKGFGHRLLAHALLRLYEAGCAHVELNTQIENAQSRRLYEKFDFAEVGGHWIVRTDRQ